MSETDRGARTYERGYVVWCPARFAEYDRPFVLVSTDSHPYYDEEFVGLAITTTRSSEAISIDDDDWLLGELPKPSYVKPWNPVIVKATEIRSVAGVLGTETVDRAVTDLAAICGLE